MKYYVPFLLAGLLIIAPLQASAHQHSTFDIGGATYEFVVGSLAEPVAVDDKTGLDLAIMRVTPGGSVPVTGLEETLTVKLVAGKEEKTLAIRPAYGKPGAYQAPFYPTRATTFSYELSGTIDGTPVELSFTCTPGGEKAKDETEAKEVAPGVRQISRNGSFGCPATKESLGFPEPSASIASLVADAKESKGKENAALGIAVVALGLALGAYLRKRS